MSQLNIEIILILFFLIAILALLVHHYYIHRFDNDKTMRQKWFQWGDVNNHETVEAILLGCIIGLLLSLYL